MNELVDGKNTMCQTSETKWYNGQMEVNNKVTEKDCVLIVCDPKSSKRKKLTLSKNTPGVKFSTLGT